MYVVMNEMMLVDAMNICFLSDLSWLIIGVSNGLIGKFWLKFGLESLSMRLC